MEEGRLEWEECVEMTKDRTIDVVTPLANCMQQ